MAGVRSYDKYAVGGGRGRRREGGGGGAAGERKSLPSPTALHCNGFFHSAAADIDAILIEWSERRDRRLLRFIFRDEREHDQLTNVTAQRTSIDSGGRPMMDGSFILLCGRSCAFSSLVARSGDNFDIALKNGMTIDYTQPVMQNLGFED